MDITGIMATSQHRYPFLLIDRILELEPGVRSVGVKNVTMNEPYMRGYTPEHPTVPPVLLVEHAAQIGCVLLLSVPANADKLGMFTGMQEVVFHRAVVPGDQIVTEVVIERLSSRAGKVRFASRVDGEVVVDGHFMFLLAPDPAKAVPVEA